MQRFAWKCAEIAQPLRARNSKSLAASDQKLTRPGSLAKNVPTKYEAEYN